QPCIALCPSLLEPLAGLSVNAIAISFQRLSRERGDTYMADPPRLDRMPRGNGNQIIARITQNALIFFDSLGPLLLCGKLVGGGDAARRAGDFAGQNGEPGAIIAHRRTDDE